MRAALGLLDHLSTLFALSELRPCLELHGNSHPAFSSMLQLVAILTMPLPTQFTPPSTFSFINKPRAIFPSDRTSSLVSR